MSKIFDMLLHLREQQPPRERSKQYALTTRIRAFFDPPDCVETFQDTGARIYVGSAANAADLCSLRRLGIGAVVNVTEETPNFFDCSGSLAYCQIRLRDIEVQEVRTAEIRRALAFIHFYVQRGVHVLVHCFMGASRSICLATMYIMMRRGWCADRAYETVRERRSIANLNNTFLFLLRNFPVPRPATGVARLPLYFPILLPSEEDPPERILLLEDKPADVPEDTRSTRPQAT